MIRSITRLRQLDPAERHALYEALAVIPWMAMRLAAGGLKRTQRAIPPARDRAESPQSLAEARAIARAVAIAARRGIWRARCLPTALALQWILARRGIASQLRLGVRRRDGHFEAHAWIEHAGEPLIDGPGVHEDFAAFAAFAPPGEEA
jgi:hypothetical protein